MLSIFVLVLLFHFANATRKIEKENYNLKNKVSTFQEQININEIELSLYVSYDYLNQIQKIYFENIYLENLDNRMSYKNFKNKNLEDFYTVGIR